MPRKRKNNKKSISVGKQSKRFTGIIKITAKPIGFVVIPGKEDDIMVFEENLNCALDKDEVEVEVIGKDRSRKKGRVTKIIKRNKLQFVGTIEKSGSRVVFKPDDFKFYKDVDLFDFPKNLEAGTKVLAEINWTNPNINPKGKVIRVIGKKGEHETEMQSILLDKGIVYNFPENVQEEAEKVSRLNLDMGDRRDFRKITTFTIDPADAKDFDDAVSYFVRPSTALDKEAMKRSFSTYLVDRTIPMLPEVLSNDLCSLNPDVDRLTFSAVFDIKKDTGEVLDRWFGKTIINSNKRFSYEEAQNLLDAMSKTPFEMPRSQKGVFDIALQELNRLAKIYREENKKNGAIEFETDEIKFELDDKGKPIKIYKKPRLDTMKMIEEWMLLANREVAKFISDKMTKRGGASIFRVHDLPNVEKIEELAIFVRALGHELPTKGGNVSARDLNILLSQIEGHASESLIKTAAIRSMAKAAYSTKNIGHFGLAFEYYTHFTSPIRRYPDLMVHRILEKYLNNESIPKNEFSKFEKIAEEASEKEIVIQEAERESIKYKQVEFMQSKIGQQFDVVISGVTEWGMYVEDPETKVEGLVRIKDLTDDYYKLDQRNYCIVGQRTKKKFSLGDSLRVRLASADLDRKTLDFKLV
jgi:ribonuclease R